jgi:exodeoxyribonuclease V gamma subunit
MTDEIRPGLLVLHGNRAELLAEAVFEWLRRSPLAPLEEEVFLVQSNGMAEWLKMALAARSGICAATRVELPGRFLWRAYRQVLGSAAVPAQSALDKLPLTWRVMQCLPGLLTRAGFEPLAGYLQGGDMERRFQLAQRLADLFDQYQVYRSDWLEAWAAVHDVLPASATAGDPAHTARPMPPDQRWQAALWREVLAPLSDQARAATRPQLHRRFLAALGAGSAGMAPAALVAPIPRRVVLFGMTHVPMQTLQALAALSAHCQVLLAVPNPCRYHWADIIEGRELLRMERRRHPLREGRDLAALPFDAMHAHAHPLLAAWGRQGRDFVRQLDAFDDAVAARQRFAGTKVDLFDDGPGETLLAQVQARIRDLVPLAEHADAAADPADPADHSIVFHIAHSAQREVEILHDQLLTLLAQPAHGAASTPLNPRDIVVMVPDIAVFAPAIRSVFGQYPRADARFIPFDIADLTERGHQPLLVALEWLLRLPQQRCRATEVRDLLDVPAVAARFGLSPEDLPLLTRWIDGAGIRWGLNADARTALGLQACGEQNTWAFGLRRMLLGYASGTAGFQGIEPYDEVGGLEASLAGALAGVVDALSAWWAQASTSATPAEWAARGRALIDAFIQPTDERECLTVAALHDALRDWLEACDTAGFDAPVALPVAREAWLSGVDSPGLGRRFRAGGVTFCTLLPMRAIPFEVVCLLGMNDGDYPRRSPRSDFDLMDLPGQQRPGDRSRRDDDRQLMLEALLSARRVLYVSWAGRSARDNSAQPPSVLVSQLRDYLAAGWRGEVLAPRTTEHPLQPFSRRYFEARVEARVEQRIEQRIEQRVDPRAAPVDAKTRPPADSEPPGGALFTYAREWRAAHGPASAWIEPAALPAFEPDASVPLAIASLARFLKNPVKDFFRVRLDVVFRDADDVAEDDEAFELGGLREYVLLDEASKAILLDLPDGPDAAPDMAPHPAPDLRRLVTEHVERMRRAGRLPMAEPGRRSARELVGALLPMLARWRALCALYPPSAGASRKEPLHFTQDGLVLADWLTGARPAGVDGGARVWLELTPGRVCDAKTKALRRDRLIAPWVRMLVTSACGLPVQGLIVGRDAMVTVNPLPQPEAQAALATLMQAWRDGMTAPLPLASKTALARAAGAEDEVAVYEGKAFAGGAGGGSNAGSSGEVEEPCLARMFPDHEALTADGRFAAWTLSLFNPLLEWALTRVTFEPHAAAVPARDDGDGDGDE